MSWEATAHVNALKASVTGEKMTRSEKLLLLVLANYHNPEHRCAWPSLTRLATDALLCRRQVIRVLSSLSKKQFIATEIGKFTRGGNIYRFVGLDPTGDIMSLPLAVATSDICDTTSDILSTTSDIAMSPNPTIEPSKEPTRGNTPLKSRPKETRPAAKNQPTTKAPSGELFSAVCQAITEITGVLEGDQKAEVLLRKAVMVCVDQKIPVEAIVRFGKARPSGVGIGFFTQDFGRWYKGGQNKQGKQRNNFPMA